MFVREKARAFARNVSRQKQSAPVRQANMVCLHPDLVTGRERVGGLYEI